MWERFKARNSQADSCNNYTSKGQFFFLIQTANPIKLKPTTVVPLPFCHCQERMIFHKTTFEILFNVNSSHCLPKMETMQVEDNCHFLLSQKRVF